MKASVLLPALALSLVALGAVGTASAHESDRGDWRQDRGEWRHDRGDHSRGDHYRGGAGYYRPAPRYYAAPRYEYRPYREHRYYRPRYDTYRDGYVYVEPGYPFDYPSIGLSLTLPLR